MAVPQPLILCSLGTQDRSCLLAALHCRGSCDSNKMPDVEIVEWHPSGQANKALAEKIPMSFVQTAHDTGSMRKAEQETQWDLP